MEFIDTHQHLIYRARFGYEWTADIEPLATGDFTLEDYRALTQGKGIARTIFMEVGVDDADYRAEARFISGLAGMNGICGQIASCRPEEDHGFEAWLEECRQLDVVGYRRILHIMPDELSRSHTFRANLAKIGAAGLPFDLCVLARQLPLAIELARALPDQQFVLDHCGVPDIAGGAFASWAADMSALAACTNVAVKLSGITAYCAPDACDAATLAPWVDHVLQAFGPARMVWGSDWPVVNLGSGLPAWIEHTKTLLHALSEEEQKAIMAGNARAIYRLDSL